MDIPCFVHDVVLESRAGLLCYNEEFVLSILVYCALFIDKTITLGTGDYGHLVIYHIAMLLRQFCSLYEHSDQDFEASLKLHCQLYSKSKKITMLQNQGRQVS